MHTELLVTARTAHMRRDWRASYDAFTRAGEDTALGTDDLDALAVAAWQLGRGKESVRVTERVFTQLARTDPPSAAMKAVELGLAWFTRGDLNIAQAWMNRARRLLDGTPVGPTNGYLAYLDALMVMQDAEALAVRVQTLRDICLRIDTPALTALCHVAEALAAIGEARMTEAFALLDEAMLPVLAGQVPLDWAGDIYCVVLNQCHHLADLPRMHAWTQSMERWCADFAASDNYGGVCDVHRLQLLVATDDYRQLDARLVAASQALEDVNRWAAGEGYYQLGEVLRLQGDADGAFAAFARARTLGVDPQPGEALLRCGPGRRPDRVDRPAGRAGGRGPAGPDATAARSRRSRAGPEQPGRGRPVLPRIRGRCKGFRHAGLSGPGLRMRAAPSWCSAGEHADALAVLQSALREYRIQKSRYETAQVYEWMALAHRGLGEDDVAAADAATAQSIYDQLGVEPAGICGSASPAGLTKRELEILTAIARGATNRQVAQQIFISEKTVARHLANIYAKLGVSSRTAAADWAHQHNLLK